MGFFKRENKGKASKSDFRLNSNQRAITIYTVTSNPRKIKLALIKQFSDITKKVMFSTPTDVNDRFILHLNNNSEISINISTSKNYITGMYDSFAQAKCRNKKLHQNVLLQIQMFNCVIGCIYTFKDEENVSDILNALFSAADALKGLVLTPDMELFNGARELVFSIAGESDFDEYTIIVNAD